MDVESGLFYVDSRYYDSNVGRFINADAQLNSSILGYNMFAYCENNYVNYYDSNGKFGIAIGLGFIGDAFVAAVASIAAVATALVVITVVLVVAIEYEVDYIMNPIELNSNEDELLSRKGTENEANEDIINSGYSGDELSAENTDPVVDPLTGEEVGRLIGDEYGNIMIEPVGGTTVKAGNNGENTHTRYPNGSNYQRLNPEGHSNNAEPHGHAHLKGLGKGKMGQGPSIDIFGNEVPFNSPEAHWTIFH